MGLFLFFLTLLGTRRYMHRVEAQVEELQAKYKELSEEKEAKVKEIKDSGLGLMKAVKASLFNFAPLNYPLHLLTVELREKLVMIVFIRVSMNPSFFLGLRA